MYGKDKEPKIFKKNLIFIEKKETQLVHPHYNALFITSQISNNWISQMLVDTGSSVDIFFKDAWK